jgi:NAD+ kinase
MLALKIDGNALPCFDYALNEIGILKAATSSLLNIHAYVKDVYLTTYWADGLIISTPTGSTAYSMSGGGPIVFPECRNLILTPICPHNLTIRPLVVPNDTEITLQVESRIGDFVLSMDSRIRKMGDHYQLHISTNGSKIKMVTLEGYNYYETLRNKLMWGEDRRNVI